MLEKIEQIEKTLTENLGMEIEMRGINGREIIFRNNNDKILKFILKVDRKTLDILDIKIDCDFYDIQLLWKD